MGFRYFIIMRRFLISFLIIACLALLIAGLIQPQDDNQDSEKTIDKRLASLLGGTSL